MLAARGLLLVGLDVIGDCLTEINVTSPTCFQEITEQTGFDVREDVHRRAGSRAAPHLMDDPSRLDATAAAALIARRELSAEALLRACLARIAERDGEVRAFVHLDAEGALAQARALDAGPLRGPLHGLPLGVKDIFDTATCPPNAARRSSPATARAVDAAAVALCREAGAVVLGKTVTTELANMTAGAHAQPASTRRTRRAARPAARPRRWPTSCCRWRWARRRPARSSGRRPAAASSATSRASAACRAPA